MPLIAAQSGVLGKSLKHLCLLHRVLSCVVSFMHHRIIVYSAASVAPAPPTMNGKASPQLVISSNNAGMQLLPNKSTLFASSTPGSGSSSPQPHHQSPSFNSSPGSNSNTPSPVPPKPTINYGKPNVAPKPPGMTVQLPGNGANAPARPTVARHQSMRSPR